MKNKYVICSPDIPPDMRKKLISLDWHIITAPKHLSLIEPIQGHPDLQFFALNNETVIIHPEAPDFFTEKIQTVFNNVIKGVSYLQKRYPNDICYNAKTVGSNFFHNLKYTDPVLKKIVIENNLKLIDVPQGYTGCSILKISDNAIITSDKNITQKAVDNGIDFLQIKSGNIDLPGMNHGFIGGTGGWDGNNTVCFCGDIKTHPDYKKIITFIENNGKNICCLSKNKLLDLGSLIFISKDVTNY